MRAETFFEVAEKVEGRGQNGIRAWRTFQGRKLHEENHTYWGQMLYEAGDNETQYSVVEQAVAVFQEPFRQIKWVYILDHFNVGMVVSIILEDCSYIVAYKNGKWLNAREEYSRSMV